MSTYSHANRPYIFALLAAGAAGIVSFILIAGFIDMLTFIFVPCTILMVFVSAYFAFRRQMRNRGVLEGKRIFTIAFEVGTLSHFYAFALYLPLTFFSFDPEPFNVNFELVGTYLLATVIGGFASLVMFVWIAIPMYMGVGYILKAMEGEEFSNPNTLDESVLDDVLVESEIDPLD